MVLSCGDVICAAPSFAFGTMVDRAAESIIIAPVLTPTEVLEFKRGGDTGGLLPWRVAS